MTPLLVELEAMARQVGAMLRAGFGGPRKVDRKGAIDLVTDMDHHSETLLLDAIQSRYPTHMVVTEERGVLHGDERSVWYLDPLDGTVNFAHGIPIFTVSIAFAQDGHTRLGVVYDPMQDECYTAERGKGAWLNGRPIRVSGVESLDQSLLVTGFPYDVQTNPENNLDYYARFSMLTQGVRRLGSAALDLCYVAAGRFDGFWEIRIYPWDVAAGGLIVEEAGGVVTRIDGVPDYLLPPHSILAANPALHSPMLEILKPG